MGRKDLTTAFRQEIEDAQAMHFLKRLIGGEKAVRGTVHTPAGGKRVYGIEKRDFPHSIAGTLNKIVKKDAFSVQGNNRICIGADDYAKMRLFLSLNEETIQEKILRTPPLPFIPVGSAASSSRPFASARSRFHRAPARGPRGSAG